MPPSLTLFILGICLWVSLRLLYGARGPAPDDGVYLLMRILSRALVLVSITGMFIASANWLAIILLVIVMAAVLELILARRAAQRQAVWGALASSAAGRAATVESLRFHQSRFSGMVGRRYRRLLDDLERGVAWPEAIFANRQALPSLAPTYMGMLAALGASDRSLVFRESADAEYRQVWHDTVQRLAYLMTVLVTLAAVLGFSIINVAPSYQGIFQDFSAELPETTRVTFNVMDQFVRVAGIPLAFVASFCLGAAVLVAIAYLCDLHILQPAFDWLGFARHRAHVLRLLAAALDHDVPLTETLARLESGWSAYPSWLMRRRLSNARQQVAAGLPWQDAFKRSRLISATDAATLRAAQQTGHLPWTMRMLADRKLRLSTFRWATVQHVLFTIAILLLGLAVFVFVTAMFIPLVKLVQELSV
jgi:protein transport protein HofC